jgi:ABC-type amino acid transport substrate-binding protein
MQNVVNGPEALSRYQNGVLAGSITQSVLSEIGIPAKVYPTVEDGLAALDSGYITAFVGGEASMRYAVHHQYAGRIVIEPLPSTHISYAFAMRPGLPNMDAIDVSVIDQVSRPGWRQQVESYIGPATH